MAQVTQQPIRVHKSSKRKYNWLALRKEYIMGSWLSIPAFLKDKAMPAYYNKHKELAGVGREKIAYQKAVLAKAYEEPLESDVEDAKKIRLRQARLARYMQLKAAEALHDPTLKITSIEDARKLLTSGLEQERKALGLDSNGDKPNSLTQINIKVGPKTQLDRLVEGASYEDILGIIAELKRGRKGSVIPEIIDGSATEAEGTV